MVANSDGTSGCINRNPEITGGIVAALVPLTKICENVNSFQAKIKLMMLATAIPDFPMGKTILKRAPRREKPSIRANPSTLGRFLKKPIIIQVTMGMVVVSVTSTNPRRVPTNPSFRYRM